MSVVSLGWNQGIAVRFKSGGGSGVALVDDSKGANSIKEEIEYSHHLGINVMERYGAV